MYGTRRASLLFQDKVVSVMESNGFLRIVVTVARVGTKSATIRYRFYADDEQPRVDARVTVACVDMNTFAAMPHPEHFRTFFERHVESQ